MDGERLGEGRDRVEKEGESGQRVWPARNGMRMDI